MVDVIVRSARRHSCPGWRRVHFGWGRLAAGNGVDAPPRDGTRRTRGGSQAEADEDAVAGARAATRKSRPRSRDRRPRQGRAPPAHSVHALRPPGPPRPLAPLLPHLEPPPRYSRLQGPDQYVFPDWPAVDRAVGHPPQKRPLSRLGLVRVPRAPGGFRVARAGQGGAAEVLDAPLHAPPPPRASRSSASSSCTARRPVRNVWRCIEHEQPALRDILDDDGTPSGRTIEHVEKVADFLGPTFEPVDLFAFYVWPVTASGVDTAELAFEDRCVRRAHVEALASRPLDPTNPKAGNIYEGLPELLELYESAISARGSSSSGAKYDALSTASPTRVLRLHSTRTSPKRSARSTSPNARGSPTSRATARSGTSLLSAPTPSSSGSSAGRSGMAARNGSAGASSRSPRSFMVAGCRSSSTTCSISSTTSGTSRATPSSGRPTRSPS